ncbi:hypothetical protein [Spirosoma sp.]|uniref:hypothetical protein n=1 Tax=Spirosoma sp. TaxID=1899569 RepID=UPI00261ADEF0|nr:hypothetical protein [Spirosoma sp.]MCX6216538.1 hypothetical protein [Spirosoma sp.]
METKRQQLSDLPFIPRWLGEPMYPGGLPVGPESMSVATDVGGEARNIRERITQYYLHCIDSQGQFVDSPPSLSEDDFQVLRQWSIYYLHAPLFDIGLAEFNDLKARSFEVSTWKQLHDLAWEAMELGLDFL